MQHRISHQLDQATARRITDQAWETYRAKYERYKPSLTWVSETQADFGFSAKGLTLRGSLGLEPQSISVDIEVPFLLRIFRDQAIEILEREIRRWITAAEAGELPA